jgi:hypothetical protein
MYLLVNLGYNNDKTFIKYNYFRILELYENIEFYRLSSKLN